MSIVAPFAAALLLGFLHPRPPITIQTYREGEWSLALQTNTFTHQLSCRLEKHIGHQLDLSVVHGALAIKFSNNLDTSDAWYEIDDGPPQAIRDLTSKLISAGSLAEGERLDNPSNGMMLIPLEYLKTAKIVTVQPVPRSTPKAINLDGFRTLLAVGQRLGCGLDGLVERTGSAGSHIKGL